MTRTVAIAARELESGARGVSRWLREVTAAWSSAGLDREATLYFENLPPESLPAGGFARRSCGPGPGGGATSWEQWSLPRALWRDRPRVLLGPANSVALLAPCPTVVVLHDLSFEARPEWFAPREGSRRRLLARASARRSSRIVVPSRFTAGEVTERYRVDPRRIRVLPNGVADSFRPVTDPARLADTRHRLGLDGDVVLAVGSLFARRRLPDLVAGFALAARRHPDARLVLIGDNRTHPPLDVGELLGRAGVSERTTWVESVAEEQLLDLYSIARVTVYLSEYEGFGLPPLEALACGCPVIASASTALSENLAGRAVLLREHTPAAVAEAVAAVLARPAAARTRPSWLSAYSWSRSAAALLEVLAEAARPRREGTR